MREEFDEPETDEAEIVVRCPKCGSEDIRERNVAYAELPVLSWQRDEDGAVLPEEYDTDMGPEWEAEDVSHQYVCGNNRCMHRMTLDELTDAASPRAGGPTRHQESSDA